MQAIIKIDIPEYQIRQPVDIYFPDSMHANGIVREEPKAKWLYSKEKYSYYCSRCRHFAWEDHLSNFCPDCGASMKKGK